MNLLGFDKSYNNIIESLMGCTQPKQTPPPPLAAKKIVGEPAKNPPSTTMVAAPPVSTLMVPQSKTGAIPAGSSISVLESKNQVDPSVIRGTQINNQYNQSERKLLIPPATNNIKTSSITNLGASGNIQQSQVKSFEQNNINNIKTTQNPSKSILQSNNIPFKLSPIPSILEQPKKSKLSPIPSILEQPKKSKLQQLDILSTPKNQNKHPQNYGSTTKYQTNSKLPATNINIQATPRSEIAMIPEDSIEDYGQTAIEDLDKIQVNFHV